MFNSNLNHVMVDFGATNLNRLTRIIQTRYSNEAVRLLLHHNYIGDVNAMCREPLVDMLTTQPIA